MRKTLGLVSATALYALIIMYVGLKITLIATVLTPIVLFFGTALVAGLKEALDNRK
ncbi:hypothetical protein FC84_GL001609 [Lapidilactobacillus dextrinicus DSM 20335]|uniref:Uncharacterized protein n=1 Tax=Lapidilactobacillus dextrinicus DSM 20335 TaxID=1423738 RepID=A0A0R2BSV5_9LACO|nr:hypothetical protein [Lapidilactobacillus dextrinicus]KRM79433.1 hypothetical protein FC84_GL001609 [Lapidilactobacillus dextrinicus DSM 20335]